MFQQLSTIKSFFQKTLSEFPIANFRVFPSFLVGIFVVSFLLIPFVTFSQKNQDTPFHKKYFEKKKRKKIREAKLNLRKADSFVKYQNDYKNALRFYKKAYRFNPNNASLNLKMGKCYQNLEKPDSSKIIQHFRNAYQLNPNAESGEIRYHLARIYHLNWRWDEAIDLYKKHIIALKGKEEKSEEITQIKRHIEECENGKNTVRWKVVFDESIEKLNSRYDEFAPIFSEDNNTLYFTAQKKGSTGWHSDDKQHYEDIYFSKKVNNRWQHPKKLSKVINTSGHDAISSISASGRRILFYRGDKNGDIYQSKLNKKNKWREPAKLPFPINTKFRETSACYTSDGKTLYFVSDRENETKGGLDIFFSTKNSKGEWATPTNLGENINTPYDEEGVFLVNDKVLYFSSKGHNSIGGYDIFRSEFVDEKWSKPQHLAIPINTPDDDVFVWVSSNEKELAYGSHPFFAEKTKGNRDIYLLHLLGKEMPLTTDNDLIASHNLYLTSTLSLDSIDDKIGITSISKIENSDTIINNNLPKTIDNNTAISDDLTAQNSKSTTDNLSVNSKKKTSTDTDFTENNTAKKTTKNSISKNNRNIKRDVDFTDKPIKEKPIILEGIVLDAISKKPVDAIVILNNHETYQETKIKAKGGKFHFDITAGKSYGIVAQAENYLFYSENIRMPNSKTGKKLLLRQLKEGSDIVLNNVFFNYNETSLKPQSLDELKHLIHLLEDNPNLKVEISGHTDDIGSAHFNEKLSLERAKVVYDFLIEAGILEEQLTYKGYGFSKPIADNKTEKGREQNRRTEFTILEY